ncbi:hypothetical protein HRbin02_00786 [Candidatus Calditenuaceae archaeon HR02]|nr:hypothetical protein HRbin02_00786 [Candidatus Calditenuaceae archaeon HR02]
MAEETWERVLMNLPPRTCRRARLARSVRPNRATGDRVFPLPKGQVWKGSQKEEVAGEARKAPVKRDELGKREKQTKTLPLFFLSLISVAETAISVFKSIFGEEVLSNKPKMDEGRDGTEGIHIQPPTERGIKPRQSTTSRRRGHRARELSHKASS